MCQTSILGVSIQILKHHGNLLCDLGPVTLPILALPHRVVVKIDEGGIML